MCRGRGEVRRVVSDTLSWTSKDSEQEGSHNNQVGIKVMRGDHTLDIVKGNLIGPPEALRWDLRTRTV